MEKEKFIATHSDQWQKLESLAETISQNGIKQLASNEIKEFLQLFRQTSRHLAYARTHYPQSNLIDYLNTLISECHSHVYAVEKTDPKSFINYTFSRLPKLLNRYKYYILASFAFFLCGGLISFLLVTHNPDQAGLFLPAKYINSVNSNSSSPTDVNYALMSSQIMVNNITVALKVFVFGITLGLGSIYVLFFNGALLGALTALVYQNGSPLQYWSLILPHGIIELTAIFISGAAGLLIARHLLLPGQHRRRDSLIVGAKKAVSLVWGVILLLITAGLIEGFFTPRAISPKWKLLFAGLTAVALIIYTLLPYFTARNQK